MPNFILKSGNFRYCGYLYYNIFNERRNPLVLFYVLVGIKIDIMKFSEQFRSGILTICVISTAMLISSLMITNTNHWKLYLCVVLTGLTLERYVFRD